MSAAGRSRSGTPGTPGGPGEIVYSEDRVRRIRLVLYVVLALGALLAVIAALTLLTAARDRSDLVAAALSLAVIAVLVLGSTAVSLRLLPGRGRPAKRAVTVTGVILVLLGLLTSGTTITLLMPLLGLAVLLIALLPDNALAS